ncbi:MAG: zinc dependent phospholipase C family protein [Chitinophagaceae bacterium]
MRNKHLKFILIAFISVCCCSWGFLVHRTVNQLAIYELPKAMRPFFYENKDSIALNAPRPDQRRNIDPTEATKHFIDIEAYGDSAEWKMPMGWSEAAKQYSTDTLLKYGYLPYQIIVVKNKLTEAFRSKKADSIVFYATDLGHYIGDAHVPLHTAINYDGQLTNQRGIHDLWETSVPEAVLDQYKLSSRHKAEYLPNPEVAIWETIRRTHALLNEMFEVEKQVSKNFTDSTKYFEEVRWGKKRRFYTKAFAKAYNDRLGKSINEQLILSADQIADFWYTAWVDAGKPDLSTILPHPFDRTYRKALKQESKYFRKNELIEKKLLIAKQTSQN